MSMTKKDYQAIARAIYAERVAWEPSDASEQVHAYRALEEVTSALADVMAADNPRFDRARFVEACETGRTKGMPR